MPSIQEYLNRIRNSFSQSAKKDHVVAFIDTEVSSDGRKVYDFGAFIEPEEKFHICGGEHFSTYRVDLRGFHFVILYSVANC